MIWCWWGPPPPLPLDLGIYRGRAPNTIGFYFRIDSNFFQLRDSPYCGFCRPRNYSWFLSKKHSIDEGSRTPLSIYPRGSRIKWMIRLTFIRPSQNTDNRFQLFEESKKSSFDMKAQISNRWGPNNGARSRSTKLMVQSNRAGSKRLQHMGLEL